MNFKKLLKKMLKESVTNPKQIANTIAQQMGGYNKLAAAIGARNFSFDKDGSLSFKFPGRKLKYVKIKLNSKDLYDMEFYSNTKMVDEVNDVYADQLISVFKEKTGLIINVI